MVLTSALVLASTACGRAVLNTPDVAYVCDGEVCTRPDVLVPTDGDARAEGGFDVQTDQVIIDDNILRLDIVDRNVPDTRVPRCGDSVLDPGEQCDDGNNVSGDGCDATCHWEHRCGDGRIDPGEVCDDGNNRSGDGCRSDCLSNETCGNRIVDYGVGEVCDGTPNCAADCRSIVNCGNHVVEAGEQCDDGNVVRWDGCSPECLREQGIGLQAFFFASASGRVGCDFSGDGQPDNAFAHALGNATGILNTAITNGISNGQFILQLGFVGLRDPLGTNEPNLRVGWMRGLDGDADPRNNQDPGNPQNVSRATLGPLGLPMANYQSVIARSHLDGGPEDILLDLPGPMGMGFTFHLAHSSLHGTLTNDGTRIATFGSLPTGTNDGTLCGAIVARDLASTQNFFGMLGGGGGPAGTLLEAIAGGYTIMIPLIGGFTIGPQQPDVDLDGDGLEYYVATPGSRGVQPRITACVDGDGTRIAGETCPSDPRMADGYTAAFQAYGPWIQFVGVR